MRKVDVTVPSLNGKCVYKFKQINADSELNTDFSRIRSLLKSRGVNVCANGGYLGPQFGVSVADLNEDKVSAIIDVDPKLNDFMTDVIINLYANGYQRTVVLFRYILASSGYSLVRNIDEVTLYQIVKTLIDHYGYSKSVYNHIKITSIDPVEYELCIRRSDVAGTLDAKDVLSLLESIY